MEESCVFIIDAERVYKGMRTVQWSMITRYTIDCESV